MRAVSRATCRERTLPRAREALGKLLDLATAHGTGCNVLLRGRHRGGRSAGYEGAICIITAAPYSAWAAGGGAWLVSVVTHPRNVWGRKGSSLGVTVHVNVNVVGS